MQSVILRYAQAKGSPRPERCNCIGFAFYLVGLQEQDGYLPTGDVLRLDRRLRLVENIADAVMIGYSYTDDEKEMRFLDDDLEEVIAPHHRSIDHLVVLHPERRDRILHRKGYNGNIKEGNRRIVSIGTQLFWGAKEYYFGIKEQKTG